ncbi:acyl-CoA dehydratase activase [Pelotomaculum propionicicum]|uniref:2-hydroxyisocaproyl-CoA dehydratase activator n=1 Tax=Pelotomaculum propionicicum TaxID=258475 RepID=A0A4Y7RSY9_9FIRM|nr:acyl-CoA dehydratase activase [Pelotomaculum propionicicum]NLI11488.1 2-hydroxyglutaryl-CoA dehydratase [Peptococcaceae bacterium]TEB11377.1 2-hydroxyisocaproyl-CoA dehydratase activator [Pelotomaculum propionicicum]
MFTVGIDVGSVTTKVVLLNGRGWRYVVRPTGCSPRQAGHEAFEELLGQAGLSQDDISCVIGTGYGRISLPFIDKAVTEITCHARGAHHLLAGADMVIDIGGQDSKVILTDGRGSVVNFAMNDKCAAGTGRFLEVIAAALGSDVSELADKARGAEPVAISSMCTVFAESEVISLLAQGVAKGRIIAGIHRSVASRVAAMAERLGKGEQIIFTGGVAKNEGVREALSRELGREIIVDLRSQLAGALGAALLAREKPVRKEK